MNRRFFILDKFNTWYDWRCTVTAKNIPDAEPKTNYINIDGANGTLDLSEALTGGPVYSDRVITASFMCSEGSHKDREALLREIRKALHGRKIQIIEPDDPTHFFLGRVKIKESTNHTAYLEFTIEATCDPWRYAVNETNRVVDFGDGVGSWDGKPYTLILHNHGDKVVTPVLTIVGASAIIFTADGVGTSITRPDAQVRLALKLQPGVNLIDIERGRGCVKFTYREADL